MENKATHSLLDQSRPAGQSSAPVRSWLKPRSTFTFLDNGGLRAWPFGVIQSRTVPFRLLVSSARALDDPLRIWFAGKTIEPSQGCRLTMSATKMISSSELLNKRSSRPGTIWRSFWKTPCSLISLNIGELIKECLDWKRTHSAVKSSSGLSANSPMRRIPFVRSVWTLVIACTVRPKCLPWWTKGSVIQLWQRMNDRIHDAIKRLTPFSWHLDVAHPLWIVAR